MLIYIEKLAMLGPRVHNYDVEAHAFKSKSAWAYSFDRSFSVPWTGKGQQFQWIYRTFYTNIGLLRKNFKRSVMDIQNMTLFTARTKQRIVLDIKSELY